MKKIYKIILYITILVFISSIGIVASQNQSGVFENSTDEHQISDAAIPEIEEAKVPTSVEEKARFENMLKIVPIDLENRSTQKGAIPTELTIQPSIPTTIPSDVSYSNPITGISTFATYFNTGNRYNRDLTNWKTYSFYLPVASYVYIDISGQINYVDGSAYYSVYIDSDYLNSAQETGSCNSGSYCYLPIQRSRLIYLSKGWHTLYLNGYAYPFTGSYYYASGYISIIAEPEYTAITVLSPNGGENWAKGTTKSITWRKDGQPGANVKIELYKGGVLNNVISAITPNDGIYSWYIPASQLIGVDYKIKITSTSEPTKYYDWSDNNFRIN